MLSQLLKRFISGIFREIKEIKAFIEPKNETLTFFWLLVLLRNSKPFLLSPGIEVFFC